MSGSVPPRSESLDAEALVLAMTLAPTAYSRNRMFHVFKDPRVKRARSRANMLRSLATELARYPDANVEKRPANEHVHLTITVERMQYTRNLDVTPNELAALRWLCAKNKIAGLTPEPEDQTMVERVLLRLSAGLFA